MCRIDWPIAQKFWKKIDRLCFLPRDFKSWLINVNSKHILDNN